MAKRKRFKQVIKQNDPLPEEWLGGAIRSSIEVICDCDTGVEYMIYRDKILGTCSVCPLLEANGFARVNETKKFKKRGKNG